jgi:hypothetical protein
VTTAGPYPTLANNSLPPVVLWTRGNPDTLDGTTGGTPVRSSTERDHFKKMGQTWSVPTISFVERTGNATSAKSAGVDFVAYMGSGYGDTSGCPGDPCEGQAIFTLDALTGDIVNPADGPAFVGQRSPLPKGGHTEPESAFANAIVANVTAYNPKEFDAGTSPHPAAAKTTRVYVGDVHGRLWKMITTAPGTAILVSDFGENQPIAAPVSLLGLPNTDGSGTVQPYVYVVTGHDRRVDPTLTDESFVAAGIQDIQADGDPAPPAAVCLPTVSAPCLWVQELKQEFEGATQFFRGSVQPATLIAETDDAPPLNLGRVFVAGTTFNPPASRFAPPGCPGDPRCSAGQVTPCRSSFDSIVGGFGAKTGAAAFDLNDTSVASDNFAIFDNSKIAGIGIVAVATEGGGDQRLIVDEGLNRPTSAGPGTGGMPTADQLPPGGKAPTGTTGTSTTPSISTQAIRSSSTVCQ